jgi:RNA polymerase sigma-70 factor (ECF subfamily)
MLTTAKYDEKALLAMVAKGDRRAFRQIYSSHLANLYHFIFLFTKSKEVTEDILQEIFIKIWENRERLPEVGSLKNYLFRSAKNKLLDNIRHLQVRQRVFSEIRKTKRISENATRDENVYREYYYLVQQAIEKLPPKRKLIFQLNIENGFSQDEIARELNISKSVVQKQIYKASYFVRQYLFKYGELTFCLIAAVLFLSGF